MARKVSKASTEGVVSRGLSITDRIRSGASGVNHLVGLAVKGYKMSEVMTHHAAVAVLFHAAEHGDPRPMNTLFNNFRDNDKTAFRRWCGEKTKQVLKQEDGSELIIHWLAYSQKEGFTCKKGMENHRKGTIDLEATLNEQSFQTINIAPEAKPYGLAELLGMLARVQKQTEKKANDNAITVPKEVLEAVKELTKVVNKVGDTKPA